MRPVGNALQRARAERLRRERWHDLAAIAGLLALVMLVMRWLPPG